MKAYWTVIILTGSALALTPVMAQDDPDTGDDTTDPVMNQTQTEKANRLSEASGVPVEEILRLRERTREQTQEGAGEEVDPGTEGEADAPQGHGWGVIAKWLGLHPGVLGNGTGDKFYPDDEDVDLPELPEVPEDAKGAANKALEKALDRAAKAERKMAREEAKQEAQEAREAKKEAKKLAIEAKKAAKEKKPKPEKPEKPVKDK